MAFSKLLIFAVISLNLIVIIAVVLGLIPVYLSNSKTVNTDLQASINRLASIDVSNGRQVTYPEQIILETFLQDVFKKFLNDTYFGSFISSNSSTFDINQNSLFSSILVTFYSNNRKLDPQLTVERIKTIIDASIAEYKAKNNQIVFNEDYELQMYGKLTENGNVLFVYCNKQQCNTSQVDITTVTTPTQTKPIFQSIVVSNAPNISILDNTFIEDTLFISSVGILHSIKIDIEIDHPCIEDLDIYLISPNQTEVKLKSSIYYDICTFNLNGSYSFPNSTSLKPRGCLSDFVGEPINGNWTLAIQDNFEDDEGSLISWTLNLLFENDNGAKNVSIPCNKSEVDFLSLMREPYTFIADNSSIQDVLFINESGIIKAILIHIYINHTCIEDLSIILISPDQTWLKLEKEDFEANCTSNLIGTYPIDLRPLERLSKFDNRESFGNWTLIVRDNFDEDNGTLIAWGLDIYLKTEDDFDLGNDTTNSNETDNDLIIYLSFSNISISDFSTIEDSIFVNQTGIINFLAIDIDINHDCLEDLDITLFSPLGTSVLLAESSNDTCSRNLKGSYPYQLTPVEELDVFFNQTINGTWRISITDSFLVDNGTFISWALRFFL